ncbi:hephaestin-like protein 1 [Argonauta hians]
MLFFSLVCSVLLNSVYTMDRHYYLAAVEVDWDYAPLGYDVTATNLTDADLYLRHGPNRIGHIYRKVIYKEFTDGTFTEEKIKPAWLGIVGPLIHGELGDFIYVHFWNRASRHFSVHPHGIRYTKGNEGALYLDKTFGPNKMDDMVPPGKQYLYSWNITSNFVPAKDDENCIAWAYHSHVLTTRDTNTGLIGPLITCKAGTLDAEGNRLDVKQEFVLLTKVFDENKSWYLKDNIKKCGSPKSCYTEHRTHDADFLMSNLMYTINGYTYGNGPDFPTCTGSTSAWHFMGMGSNSGLHSIHFEGQVILRDEHVLDSLRVAPAIFRTATLQASSYPGSWLISCQVTHHYMSGMLAYLKSEKCESDWMYDSGTPEPAAIRRYFLSVEETLWDYAPSGNDLFVGGRLDNNGSISAQVYAEKPNRIGRTYKKALFYQYKDSSYMTKLTRNKDEVHLGFLGPIIKVEEGERVEVYLRNFASRPYSFVPRGTIYETNGLATQPGKTERYVFEAPLLGPRDPPCKVFYYLSAVNLLKDLNSGLVGPLIICKKGIRSYDDSVENIDREFVLLFSVTDENLSWYLEDNIATYIRDKTTLDRLEEDFIRSNLFHVVNGYGYANLPGLDMCVGDRVMWHMFNVGNEFDVHTIYFHGHTYHTHGANADAEQLSPALSNTVIMDIDNPGKWALVCRTGIHYQTGMIVLYNVKNCPYTHHHHHHPSIEYQWFHRKPSTTRYYYIAAVEVQWEYAPLKRGIITGEKITDPKSDGYIYVRNSGKYIGSVYKKAVYREFTDRTFTKMVKRGPREIHLDLLGPMIKAEVGDRIKVVFKNQASRPYSIHPQGVRYDKQNEGQIYLDGYPNKKSGKVAPGDIFEYTWDATESSGPGSGQSNCIPWIYYSSTEPIRDPYSGLIGNLVICRKGYLDDSDRRTDVDREFSLLFFIINENLSWYLSDNLAAHTNVKDNTTLLTDPEFYQSNLMFTINGRIFGNNQGLIMRSKEHIAWYIMSHGSDKDVHTAHFHGQTYLQNSDGEHRADVLEVSADVATAVEIRTDNPGKWILHCHVNEHIIGGMETAYTVLPEADKK